MQTPLSNEIQSAASGEKFDDNKTQEKITALMLAKPTVSAKAIAEEIGITQRGVEKSIRELKKAGLVERVGSAKGGHWVVKNERSDDDI